MNKTISQFPIQRLPLSKKTQQWKEDCIDYIIGLANTHSTTTTSKEEMQSYYDLYNGIYNEKDLKYVTNPFNQKDGFPATAYDFNIIKSKIDLMLGEETKNPFNFRVCRTSEIASSEIQDKAKQMLLEYVQASIMSKLGPEEKAKYEESLNSGEVMTPDEIQKYLTKDYKDVAETTAYYSLKYLINKLNSRHEFMKGLKDGLIAGIECFYVGIHNGEPCHEQVNPLYFSYDDGEGIEFIHDAAWCVREMHMDYSTLYDKFYDKLTEAQLNKILRLSNQLDAVNNKIEGDDFNHLVASAFTTNHNDNLNKFVCNDITVYHACWKSLKEIGFVTILDEDTQEEQEIEVDEFYKPTGNEKSIEWKWIVETWEGYKAQGFSSTEEELYFGIGPVETQFRNGSNLNSAKLPYTGATFNKSLVAITKPLQLLYIIIWYRLELAIAKDKGKVPLIDITTIPKSMGIDVEKWMHYLSALGVAFINPYEEGWDIPGREGGKSTSFNNFQSLDLTMSNSINTYIGLLGKIEQMMDELSGITKQRQGSISPSELVSNVNTSVGQSANITEPLFWLHNQVKRNVLSMLLDTAKYAWKDNKKYLNYVFDDGTRAFLQLDDSFSYEDLDLFVSNNSKEGQLIDQLKSLSAYAIQSGASMLDIAEMYTLDNVNLIKSKLQDLENNRIQKQQALEQQQQNNKQQLLQMQNEQSDKELIVKQAELELQKYKIDQDNITKVTVAQLNAYKRDGDQESDNEDVANIMEIGKQSIEQQRANSESYFKQMEVFHKEKAEENKKEIEKNKIETQRKSDELKASIEKNRMDLEKLKLKEAKSLQSQKDKAAMEREKLKAKVALQNKVVGENNN